jgi:hypothetical protein
MAPDFFFFKVAFFMPHHAVICIGASLVMHVARP